MKNSIYFSLLFFLSTNLIFAQTADVNQGCIPFEVNFTAPSGNTSFFWDFGNGTTSTLENPSGTFTSAGNYTVSLYDQPSGSLVGTVNISAYSTPTLQIFASPSNIGCAPYTVDFSYTSDLPPGVNVLQQQWVFGDGGSASTNASSVSHTFLSGGTYFVSLEIITDAATCNKTQIFEEFIIAQGESDSSIETDPTPAQSCTAPFDITFSPVWNDASSYFWDFGNGTTSNLQNPPTQTYGDGNHSVTLTVTDSLGCTSTTEQIVSVGSPILMINIPDTLCINIPYQVPGGNPPLFHIWDFGPNATPQIAGIATPEVTFTSEGLQTVTLTATALDQSCSTTITKDVYVEQAVADFTTDPNFSCANPLSSTATPDIIVNGAIYDWGFFYDGDSIASGTDPIMMFDFVDSSEYYPYSQDLYALFQTSLGVTTPAGCKAFASNFENPDTIALYKANFFESEITGCAPLEVTFTDSSVNKEDVVLWEWFVDGTLVQSSNTPADFVYTFLDRGEYEVFLVISTNDPNCPGDTSAVHLIEVGELYDLSNIEFELDCALLPPIVICPGEPIPVIIPPGGLVIDGVNISSQIDSIFILNGILYIEDNGCISEGPIDITIICPPITVLPEVTQVLECESTCDDPYTINVSGANSINADTYFWNFGDGNTSTAATLSHTYSSVGDYYLTFFASNSTVNCPPSTRTILVQIRDIEASLAPIDVSCSPDSLIVIFDASDSEDVYETCSTGYNWDFIGDELPPFWTSDPIFDQKFLSGTFDYLVLITKDINGCTDTTRVPISIYGADMAIAIDDDRICNSQDITFTNLSSVDTTVVSFFWDFGDGTTSTEENPIHNYSSPPVDNNFYIVDFAIVDALGCTYSIKDTIGYYNLSTSIETGAVACLGQSFNISAADFTSEGSFLNFDWNFGNGTTGTGASNDVVYNQLGFFDIVLNYEEASSGCSRTVTTQIEVVPFPEASFISDNDNSNILCAPANIFFTNTSTAVSTATYEWDFGNGQTSVFEDPATVFEAGEYTVTLVVTNDLGCQDSVSRMYTVLDPNGSFTVDRTTICKGEDIIFELQDTSDVGSFTWDFGDGVTVSDVSPITHTYDFHPPSGTTVATLILYSEGGFCPLSVDTSIFIQEVIADFDINNGLDTATCFAEYTFNNLSQNADSYFWDFGDGATSSEENPVHEYTDPGTYEVSLFIENDILGCNDEITFELILYPEANLQIEGDTICLGEGTEIEILNYNSNSTYTWSPQEWIDMQTDSTITTSPPNSVIFNLVEETEFGCIAEGDANVLVVLNPDATASFDTTVVMGSLVTLPVIFEDYYIFNWNPEEGLSCTDCSNPIAGPVIEETTYMLNVADIYGCAVTDLAFTISVHPETFIEMPTTFTPNGDNANNEIFVEGWGIKELKFYQIFNRWGEKIFETSDINQGWDGTFKGVPQNSDVYAFKIKAINWNDEEMVKEGFINLVR